MKYPDLFNVVLEQATRFLAVVPFLTCQIVIQAVIWTKFEFENWFESSRNLTIIGVVAHISAIIGYFMYWTWYLEYSPPAAFNAYLAGTFELVAITVALFGYDDTLI